MRRLQDHAALEAEVARLRGLLLDVRGRIDPWRSRTPPTSADPIPALVAFFSRRSLRRRPRRR
jgi:hypothetical protein